MTVLAQILAVNHNFVKNASEDFKMAAGTVSKVPRKKLAILTCMDTRLVEFLEPALGIKREDAVVIKNAGNMVTGNFEATIRSLLIGIFELGIEEIMVIGHEDCGVAHSSGQDIIDKMRRRGISYDAIKMIKGELETWLDSFHHPHENVCQVVDKIRNNPLIPADVPIHGLIFEPHTGEIITLVNGYQGLTNSNQ